jgi:hypothetical protein
VGIYVSRQSYYYSGERVVEVELNGLDYSGADMLSVGYKNLGEGKEYDDPREAIKAAVAIRDAWRKDEPDEEINIALGSTGGMGMEIEPTEKTDDELKEWAEERWNALPKCERCGDVLDPKDTYHRVDFPDFGDFCSENCVEMAIDEENQRTCQHCNEDVPEGRKYFCSDECEEAHEDN